MFRSAHAGFPVTAGRAIAGVAALTLLTGCDSGDPEPTSAGTSTPVVTVTVAPTPTEAPTTPPPPPPLGWPRDGWSIQLEDLGVIAVYYPNTWSFDDGPEAGYWTDGTYRVFCDAYVDHSLNDPGAPNAETIATTQWSLMGATVSNQHAITTFYGYEGWGGDYELPLMPGTVEPRAYVVVGDVWVVCGAITRNTAATGAELWDIIDSLQIVDQSAMQQKAWNSAP